MICNAASMKSCIRSTSCVGDLGDVLREDKFVAARQNRDRARAEALQLRPPGRVFQHIDRLELDPTDREKLLESQAAGSARLPERLQWLGLGHWARFLSSCA